MNVEGIIFQAFENYKQLFLYSMYPQRAGKTSLFHMRAVDSTHFNTCCTFKSSMLSLLWVGEADQSTNCPAALLTQIHSHNVRQRQAAGLWALESPPRSSQLSAAISASCSSPVPVATNKERAVSAHI